MSPRPEQPRRRWATLPKAAEYFDCSVKTIRRYISDGALPGYQVGDRRSLKVDLNDLDALARRVPSAREPGSARRSVRPRRRNGFGEATERAIAEALAVAASAPKERRSGIGRLA